MTEQDTPDPDTTSEPIPTVRERLTTVLSPAAIQEHHDSGVLRLGPDLVPVTDLDQPAPKHLSITIGARG